ncbi:MAG: hypothetical protein OHK0053_20690 [Microscillaceae bacterium]
MKKEFGLFSYKALTTRPEAATYLLQKNASNTILRLVDLAFYSKDQLLFEWNFLNEHKHLANFPSQQPINFFDISDTIKGIELSYIEGFHPRVNSRRDFLIFGASIAKFHQVSRGKEYENLPLWNAERIVQHFSNPILELLLFDNQLLINLL